MQVACLPHTIPYTISDLGVRLAACPEALYAGVNGNAAHISMSEPLPEPRDSPNGENGPVFERAEPALPPVEPPSGTFLAQLFLIPGLVVAVLVGLVWLFFGWLAPGSYEPQDFLRGLRSNHDPVRWRTAQDLAQILPRKQSLRLDVAFALDLAGLLEEELNREASATVGNDPGQAPHLAEFLPAALGHFHVPVGVPVLCRMIRDNVRHIEYLDDGQASRTVNLPGLRVRNSLVALANLGGRLEELEAMPAEEQDRVWHSLRDCASQEGRKGEFARLALDYLESRRAAAQASGEVAFMPSREKPFGSPPALVRQLDEALALAVNCEDEMSRKFACLALANWPEAQLEPLLLDLLRSEQVPRLLESVTPQRAIQEIQYNAALGLLRRHSPRTPWRLLEELLDEKVLIERYRDNSPQGYDAAAVSMVQLATLRTLYEAERKRPGFLREQPDIIRLVEKLESSSNAAVQIEARRLLGTESLLGRTGPRVSRELLLLVGVGMGVGILLLVAVVARWKRHLPNQATNPPSFPNSLPTS
ncbi:hypothetical protein HRbin36_00991 [bacterium HR36]|nr:hypothetical protein HRbin36_00991 [bacterium HR36]